jgi:hypothetical protein
MREREIKKIGGSIYRASQDGIVPEEISPSSIGHLVPMRGINAIDALENMVRIADRLDHQSHHEDIRIRLTINGESQPEGWLGDYPEIIGAWMRGGRYVS